VLFRYARTKKKSTQLRPLSGALGDTLEIGFTLFKNISIASFTFLPVVVLALITYVVGWVWYRLHGKRYYVSRVVRPCLMAKLWQFIFMIATGFIFGLLYLLGKVNGIPLVVLLPLSTIVSFFIFIKVLFAGRRVESA